MAELRTEPMPPWDGREEFMNAHCRVADHRASPHQVLEDVSEQLAAHGLEIVMLDSGSDEYIWRVAARLTQSQPVTPDQEKRQPFIGLPLGNGEWV